MEEKENKCNCQDEKGIPRCQIIQNEYKGNLEHMREVIHAIKDGERISEEAFIKSMEFVYREGWGDCFAWSGEVSGKETLKEFFKILPIKRYGRNSK